MRRDGSLIDKKSYADFGLDAGEDKVVNSDLHLEVLLKALQPTATGMCGVSYSSSAEEVVRKVASKQYVGNFENSRLIFYQKEVDGISLWGYVAFDNDIRIFQNGDWKFNPEAHPIGFKAMIMTDNEDRLQGKGNAIYAAFCKVIARIGKNKTWDEDGGQVYEVSDDSYAAAGLLENQCGLFIAKKGVLMRGNDWDPDAYSSLTEDY